MTKRAVTDEDRELWKTIEEAFCPHWKKYLQGMTPVEFWKFMIEGVIQGFCDTMEELECTAADVELANRAITTQVLDFISARNEGG